MKLERLMRKLPRFNMALYELMVDGEPAVLRAEPGEGFSTICTLEIEDRVREVYCPKGIWSFFTVLDKMKKDGYNVYVNN